VLGFIPIKVLSDTTISCSAKVLYAALSTGAPVDCGMEQEAIDLAYEELKERSLVSESKDGVKLVGHVSVMTALPAPAKVKEKRKRVDDPWITQVVDQFYGLSHTTTPTPQQKQDAARQIRLTLRDMGGDSDITRKRLSFLLRFAVDDTGDSAWGGWRENLRSLAAIRRVGRNGLRKWENIESAAKAAHGGPQIAYDANKWDGYKSNG